MSKHLNYIFSIQINTWNVSFLIIQLFFAIKKSFLLIDTVCFFNFAIKVMRTKQFINLNNVASSFLLQHAYDNVRAIYFLYSTVARLISAYMTGAKWLNFWLMICFYTISDINFLNYQIKRVRFNNTFIYHICFDLFGMQFRKMKLDFSRIWDEKKPVGSEHIFQGLILINFFY